MKVLLFGSSGFFGSHIKDELIHNGYNVHETHKTKYDLMSLEQTRTAFLDSRPDIVIHAAGYNGGLEWNRKYPADILHQNTTMANNIIDQSLKFNCKLVFINAVCAYPDQHKSDMTEDKFLDGRPDNSVEFHAYSKRHLVNLAKAFKKQHGMKISNLCFTNMFGPGCSFDPVKSKVVEAVIKKIVDAKHDGFQEVVFWGDGTPTREFIYAPDAAKFLIKAMDEEFINIGTGESVSVIELVNKVIDIVGYEGNVIWDTTKPNGQPERKLNISKFKKKYKPEFTPIDEALKETIEYYADKYGKKI